MRAQNFAAVALSALLVAGLPSTARAQANGPVSTNASNFNGTAIPQGRYIWFTGVCKVTGVPASGAKIYLNNSTVTFSANSVNYTVNVPNSILTFAPSTTAASATFNTGTQTWEIALPTSGLSGNVLLGAVAYQVPVNFPGGIDPVTWTGTFATDTAGLTVKWQWGAAVYTTFSSTYSALGIKTVDDNHDDANYQNSDHAGTPENFKTYVVGGARGGGGSNWTGSLSGTKTVSTFNAPPGDTTPPTIAPTVSPLINGFTTKTPTIQAALADPGAGASGVNPATFHATLDGSNVTSSFSVTASNASATLGPLTGGPHTLVFTVNDNAGNTGSATLSINVDATPPLLSLAPATGTFQGPTTAVTGTYSDAGLGVSVATFHATLDGNDVTGSFTAGASSATASLGPLANGSHTLTVTIADLGGNLATTSATYQVDTVPPVVAAVVTPLSSGYTSGTPAVMVSYSDPSPGSGMAVASFHATLDGSDVTSRFTPGASSAPGSLGPLASGAHTLVVSIADNVGNVGQTIVTFSADLVAPTVTVVPANGTTASSNQPTITVLHSDPSPGSGVNLASVLLKLDGVSLAPTGQTASSTTFVPSAALAPGTHSLESRASDNVGNTTILNTTFTVPSAVSAFVLAISPGNPSALLAGSANDLTIRAVDSGGTTVPSFTGLVTVHVSDGQPPLDGLVVSFTASNNGVVTVPNLATFQTLGALTITATANANPSITGSLGVNVLAVVSISPTPLSAVVGAAGTQPYTLSVTPTSAPATLTITGSFATFAGGGATSITRSHGGTFTLDGVAVGTDSVTVTVNGVVRLLLPVNVTPGAPPSQPPFVVTTAVEPEQNPASDGGTVYLTNGQSVLRRVDMAFPGRGGASFAFVRTYKSYLQYDGPLGVGWTHGYDMRLRRVDSSTIEWLTGTGRAERFDFSGGAYRSPVGFFARLLGDDTGFTIREPNGTRYVFNSLSDPLAPGMLKRVQDRNGNALRLLYGTGGNGFGRLAQVVDPYEHTFTFAHDAQGRIVTLTDDTGGRVVRYRYSSAGDLVKVTSPAVVTTTLGGSIAAENQFPNGKSEIYAYTTGLAASLNHKMTLVVAPNQAVSVPDASLEDEAFLRPLSRLENVWDTTASSSSLGRVLSQRVGGTTATGTAGGTFNFSYTAQTPSGADPINDETLLVSVLDRNANLSDFFLNVTGQCVRTRDYANRNLRPRGTGPGQDPAFFESFARFNVDGLRTSVTRPLGNRVAWAHDSASPNRSAQANVLSVTATPDVRGDSRGGTQPRVSTFVYEPVFQQVRAMTDARGNDATYTHQNGGAWSSSRYTSTNLFDYQQSLDTAGTLAALAAECSLDTATLSSLLASSGTVLGQGDLNEATSDDSFHAGNLVVAQAPSVTLTSQQTRTQAFWGSTQTIKSMVVHNSYGQPIRTTDAERNVSTMSYFSSFDPDGDGIPVAGTTQTDTTGGYLAQTVADAVSDSRRETGTNPAPTSIAARVFYDPVGNGIRTLDARGIEHRREVNALNQTVRTLTATDTSQAILPRDRVLPSLGYETLFFFDANNNLVESRVGNQGERDGTGAFVATNPYWTTKTRFDVLDEPIVVIHEVSPTQDDATLTENSPGVTVKRMAYDPNQNLTMVTKADGNIVSVLHDERDLVFKVTRGFGSPEAATTTRHYDLNGNGAIFVDAFKDNAGKNVSFGEGDVTFVTYDGFDEAVRTVDGESNAAEVVYDPTGARVRSIAYGSTEELSPRLAESACFFDEAGRMFQSHAVLFTYTAASLTAPFSRTIPTVASVANSGEQFAVSLLERDARGRIVRSLSPKYDDQLIDYDGMGRVRRAQGPLVAARDGSNPVRSERQSLFDGAGNAILTIQTDRATRSTTPSQTFTEDHVYDAVGRKIRWSDNRNSTRRAYFDSRSNEIATSDARSAGVIVDPLALRGTGPVSINADGNVTRKSYDGLSRMTRVERLLKVNGAGDGDPNLVFTTNLDHSNSAIPTGIIVNQVFYDRNGRVSVQVDANGNATTRAFDALDRCTQELFADTSLQTTTYTADGLVQRTVDPNGSVVQRSYDAIQRLLRIDVLTRATNLAGTGQDVLGTTLQGFEYDGLSRLRGAIDDNGAPTSGGTATNLTFDSLSRKLTERTRINCSVGVNNVFTTNNRLNVASVSGGVDRTVTSGYGPLVSSQVYPVRTSITYPNTLSGTTYGFAIDGRNRVQAVAQNGVPAQTPPVPLPPGTGPPTIGVPVLDTSFLGGRVEFQDSIYGAKSEIEFCACGCENERTETFNDTTVYASAIVRDPNDQQGTVTRSDVVAPSKAYGYDSLDRITSVDQGGALGFPTTPPMSGATTVNAAYQFDGACNFVSRTENGVTTKANRTSAGAYSPDALNRYTKLETLDAGGSTLATDVPLHDTAGARLRDKSRRLFFDALQRLVRVDRSFDGGTTYRTVGSYAYDALGRRTSKVATLYDATGALVRTESVGFIPDGARDLLEFNLATGLFSAFYVYGSEGVADPFLMFRVGPTGSRVYYIQYDENESAVVASSGVPFERYEYSSIYGKHRVTTPGLLDPANANPARNVGTPLDLSQEIRFPFRFHGQRFDDESGLYYFRNRYMDPDEGRFVSRDPIGIWGDPGSLGNGYAFCGGNPINRRDPFGLDSSDDDWAPIALFAWVVDKASGGRLQVDKKAADKMIGAVVNGAGHAVEVLAQPVVMATDAVDILGDELMYGENRTHPRSIFYSQLEKGSEQGLSVTENVCNAVTTLAEEELSVAGRILVDVATGGASELLFATVQGGLGVYQMYTAENADELLEGQLNLTGSSMSMGGWGLARIGRAAEGASTGRRSGGNADAVKVVCEDESGFCFLAGTLVVTESDQKPIESIRPGDQVLSQDDSGGVAGDQASRNVIRLFPGITNEVCYVRVSPVQGFAEGDGLAQGDGAGSVELGNAAYTTDAESEIRCTPGHRFYVAGRGWVSACDLRAADTLLGSHRERLRVVACRVVGKQVARTYNFEVEGWHTYFVAASKDAPAVWVHNASCEVKGFKSEEQFKQLGEATAAELKRAGLGETQAYMQGSAVTGKSFETGDLFDVEPDSDFGIALAGRDVAERAESVGIKIKGTGHSRPLEDLEVGLLGLTSLRDKLSRLAGGRTINFMIFDSPQSALTKARSVWIPRR